MFFCFFGANMLVLYKTWHTSGSFLLFFGVLTLVNAPFDWAAVGLTRALLRRGLAVGGPGPLVFAIVDFIIGSVMILVLAIVAVIAVQTFDDIAALRGGPNARILPLDPLFRDLETTPTDARMAWVWLMLFSTLIPSVLNLMIGSAAVLRGFGPVRTWILKQLPPGGVEIRDHKRWRVAALLSGQIVGGAMITTLTIYGIVFYIVPLGLPALGGFILSIAHGVEAADVPGAVMRFFHNGA
jgi:hypothetical protein